MVPHAWIAWLIFSWLGFLTFVCVWMLIDRRGKREALAAGQAAVAVLQAKLAGQDEQIGNLTRALALLGPADAQTVLSRSVVAGAPVPAPAPSEPEPVPARSAVTARGELLEEIRHAPAGTREHAAAADAHARAAAQMGRELDTADIRELLYRNYEHPRWDDVAERCLACGNCTMACPTCFCTSVEDVTDLAGEHVERHERWDSCFTIDYSHISGGAVRSSTRSRYRQWMTHKLATWIDQFGSSGCVGCGRCITWCPVGIDITEEARAIRESEGTPRAVA